MLFKFVPGPGFDFLTSFARKFNIPVEANTLTIPVDLGEGTIRSIALSTGMKLIVHRYKLHKEFVLKRVGTEDPSDLVSIIFHSNEIPASIATDDRQHALSKNNEFAIQIASSDLNSVIRFPANEDIYFVVVGVTKNNLKKMLHVDEGHKIVDTILAEGSRFLFYEGMTPDVHTTLKQLTDLPRHYHLSSFFYNIKAQELLYLLFEKLLQREAVKYNPLNRSDADAVLLVRNAVLADLGVPPRLEHLAKMAGFSETKMKNLFKQVFGDSIYNYYQKARMEEAAFLIKHSGLSVSEAGYRLGFSNLSHFSRLFGKHYGITPKKYSSA